MPAKAKTPLSNISKEHETKFGNNKNHEALIIEKSVLLLN